MPENGSLIVKENMAFVRENISEEDIKAYGLDDINERFWTVGFTDGWVMDRERDIYLRWIKYDRENPTEWTFTFYWKGTLLELQLVGKTQGDANTGGGSTTWSLVGQRLGLPPELEPHREEVMQDLRDALRAYGNFGMSSTINPHTAIFNF